jgi:hypothetical protein
VSAPRPASFVVFLASVVAAALALLAPRSAHAAAPQAFVEFVAIEVKEHQIDLRFKTSLREAAVATGAAPMMPPTFQREELDDALKRFGTYLVDHVHVLARGRALPGKVVATRIVSTPDGGVSMASGLDESRAEVDLVYELGTSDPLTISFDVLADMESAPGVPWSVVYSVDVRGPRSQHADLGQGTSFTFDVVEANIPAEKGAPRVGGGGARRSGPPLGGAAIGLAIFCGLLYIGWSVIKKRMGR